MERQKENPEYSPEKEDEKDVTKEEIEHTVTVMMNEPMKFGLPYGARLSDLLKKLEEEYAKKGKKLNTKEYSIMLNAVTMRDNEDPVLIKASVISLVQKITGGNYRK